MSRVAGFGAEYAPSMNPLLSSFQARRPAQRSSQTRAVRSVRHSFCRGSPGNGETDIRTLQTGGVQECHDYNDLPDVLTAATSASAAPPICFEAVYPAVPRSLCFFCYATSLSDSLFTILPLRHLWM
jgi:hypothetical protein